MYWKPLYLAVLLFFTAGASAQTGIRHTVLFIEPAALINVFSVPSLRLGAELPFGKHIRFVGTAGSYLRNGFVLKGELKYVTADLGGINYFSLEYAHMDLTRGVTDNHKIYDSSKKMSVPGESFSYDVYKQLDCFNIKLGFEQSSGHFFFDYYFGAGIRKRHADISITKEEQDALYHFHESILTNVNNSVGNALRPNFVAGIRVGWRFVKGPAQ